MPRMCWVAVVIAWFALASGSWSQTDEDVEKWFERGEVCANRGSWKRAVTYFEKVLAARKDDEDVAGRLATALEAVGGHGRLDEITRDWSKRTGGSRPWFLRRIGFLGRAGRDDQAMELIRESLARESQDYLLESLLGGLLYERGRRDEAAAIFEGLVDRAKLKVVRKPGDLMGLARAYLSYGHGARAAEEVLIDAQKASPKDPRIPALLARAYRSMGLAEDMRREFKDALELRPKWPEFLVGLADAADMRLGQAEGRKKERIDEALKLNPRYPPALFHRGMNETGDALWKQARGTFEKALEVNPNHLPSLSGMAALLWITNRVEESEVFIQKVLGRNPQYGDVYRIVADALNSRRRWDEALEVMQKAVKVDPQSPRLWDDLARYAFYLGQEDLGRESLKKADALSTYGRIWRNNMNTVLGQLDRHYVSMKTDHFLIKMHKTDAPIMKRYLPNLIEGSWRELSVRYGFEPEGPVLFEMFKSHDDFSARTMGTTGLGALGVCFGRTITMDSPRAQRAGSFNWASTAHHEFAHVVTLQLSRGRVPRWLTEGLSTHEETRRSPSWGRNMEELLHDVLHNDSLFKVMEFDKGFHGPRIIFAYYQGGLACDYIEKRWGWEVVPKMLRLYGEDKLTPQVLKEALGTTPGEFDGGFRDYVRAKLKPLERIPSYGPAMVGKLKREISEGRDVTENRIKVAWGYFRQGKYFDSDAALKPLLDHGDDDVRIDLLQAARAFRNKRRDIARKHYELALEAGSRDFDMFMALGEMAEERDEFEEAKKHYQAARKSHPWAVTPSRSPFLILARLHLGEGDREGWARELEAYCALVDTAVKPRQELVEFHRAQGNTQRCLELLAELNNIVPFSRGIHVTRGGLLLGMDDFDRASVEFEAALDLGGGEQDETGIRLQLARALLGLKRKEDAIYHLERVLEIDSDNAEARRLLERARGN